MDTDQSTWPTKQDVSRELGVSERTLEMKIKAGKIRADERAVPGRKPLVIIHPEDFAAMQAKTVKAQPAPKEIARRVHAEVMPKPKTETALTLRNLRQALAAGVVQLPIHQVRWLSLSESAMVTGLPRDLIKEAISDGTLAALTRGQRTFIKWSDLEQYHPHGEIPKTKRTGAVRNASVIRPQIASDG